MRRRIVLFVVAALIAVLGAAMVAVYVNSASNSAAATPPTKEDLVKVLAATAPITAGESVAQAQSAGKFALISIPPSSVVPGSVTSIDTIDGQVALFPIYPGEQILAAKFGTTGASQQVLPVPKGKVAISVQLSDPGRVAGFVTPGSHVAIFVTVTNEVAESYTRVLVSDVEVIGVGFTTLVGPADSADPAAEPVSQTILTVAMSQRDADRVIFASINETVGFGLLGQDTKFTPDPGVTEEDLRK